VDLAKIRQERQKWLTWKNIAPLQEALASLPNLKVSKIGLGDTVEIDFEHSTPQEEAQLRRTAMMMKPWRKGPFRISQTMIDSEWQSFIKYSIIEPHFDPRGKVVGDIGCNNGYYLFRMMERAPKKLVGFDPSALTYSQFRLVDHYIRSGIVYELLGVEHVEFYEHRFDLLFCLGVLYHRSDPISTLKSLYKGLKGGGELILDTFMIEGEAEVSLTPKERYSKIPNIYFIPTVNALKNWCYRAGFKSVEVIAVKKTALHEQRKTEWIDSQSLDDFLDPEDDNRTVEGYPAPQRVYIKACKTSQK